jgi:hypothetical protein
VADVFDFVPGYKHYIYASGREPIFFLLLAFLVAFAAVRTYTRLSRSRGWGSGSLGGVHLHHLVPGIVATLVSATAIIAFQPGGSSMLLLSACFGAGAALILDEFALVLHLEDVYWTEHGRSSIDAALMGFAFGVLCLLATAPIHSDPGRDAPHWVVGGVIALNTSFALIAFLKGKTKLGAFGIFVPGIAVVAALRLAKPSSLWAHRRYSATKIEASERRAALQHRRYAGVQRRLYDTIGGRPTSNASAVESVHPVALSSSVWDSSSK